MGLSIGALIIGIGFSVKGSGFQGLGYRDRGFGFQRVHVIYGPE